MKWDERIGRRLKLHDLHVFIAVAELGSMRKAAERLAVSQPSVSKAIADIERVLGMRLLERNAQGVEATPYGHALLRRALGAFDELRQGGHSRRGRDVPPPNASTKAAKTRLIG